MKKSRNKIIIKTRKGGFTKLYANGKWQHKVTDLDFHGDCNGGRDTSINIECKFDTLVCNSKGIPVVENNELVRKHHIVRF